MKKQTIQILLLLTSCLLPSFVHGEDCVPSTDYKFSAYVFNERFPCKKEENKEIRCGVFGKNIKEEDSGKILPCGAKQQIHVTDLIASGYLPNNPIQEANNMANKDQAKYRKQGGIVQVYQCQNQNIAMSLTFLPYAAQFIVYLFHEDSDAFLVLNSKLPYDLPANSPLIAQTTQALQTYLCYSFDPKKFLDTLEAPPFAFPDRRAQSTPEKTEPEPAKQTEPEPVAVSEPKKATTPPLAKNPAPVPSKPQPMPTIAPEKPTKNTVATEPAPKPVLPDEKPLPPQAKFRLADIVFYPAFSPVPEVRHFESADKTVDLKVNFKTGDKSAFRQKLRKTFGHAQSRETECANQNILLEFLVGSSYRAFLLHPTAILSWEEPAYANALSDLPSENQKRQELCDLNLASFWK